MITISYGCTFLGDQCTKSVDYRFECTFSPETMMLVAMRQAVEEGWSFVASEASRALCPEHNPATVGDLAMVRVFARLHQVEGVHGFVMVGVEEIGDRGYVCLGASRSPEPAGLVRLRRAELHRVTGALQDMAQATLELMS